jgi:hypothetical protein
MLINTPSQHANFRYPVDTILDIVSTTKDTSEPVSFNFEINIPLRPETTKGKDEGYVNIGFFTESEVRLPPTTNSVFFKAKLANFACFDGIIRAGFTPSNFPARFDPYQEVFVEHLQCLIAEDYWKNYTGGLILGTEYLFVITILDEPVETST